MTQSKLGLVLSGGGVQGVAHIGVIKVMEEVGLSADYVAGTSIGALVGALYASGYSALEILNFFKETKMFSWRNFTRSKPGIVDIEKFIPVLKEYLPADSFEVLKRKLFVVATDILEPRGVTFSEGSLIKKVLASAALPLLFTPVEMEDGLYADGGMTNNFPIEPLQLYCKKKIGVYCNPLLPIDKSHFKSGLSVLERSYHISLSHTCTPKFSLCDVFIAPSQLTGFSTLNANHLQEVFDVGYQAAKEQIELFERLVVDG